MRKNEAQQLFAYCSWANGRIFAAAKALPTDQAEETIASSFPSIRRTLGHIVAAEWVWLRRWRGESPSATPAWATEAGLAELEQKLAAVEAERAEYLDSLSDADLEQTVSYRTIAGDAFANELSGLIRHVVNHSSYHRGQVATMLRQLDRTPPNTDFITYLRQST